MTTPRQALAEHAQARAELARRTNHPDVAYEYDALAAELRGPSDLATATRLLADDYQEAGHVVGAAGLLVLAEAVEGTFPCGHEVRTALIEEPDVAAMHEAQGPPIDGREVDRAPEDIVFPLPHTNVRTHTATIRPRDHDGHTIPIPGPVQTGHWWLRQASWDFDAPCYCLIGQDHKQDPITHLTGGDHVAAPRFEKED